MSKRKKYWPCEYCPVCKRNMAPGEPPFDLANDNHVDRCINKSRVPKCNEIEVEPFK